MDVHQADGVGWGQSGWQHKGPGRTIFDANSRFEHHLPSTATPTFDNAQDNPPIKGALEPYHKVRERSKRQNANISRFFENVRVAAAACDPKERTPCDKIPCGVCSDWIHKLRPLLLQLAHLVSMLCAGSWRLSCHVWGTLH